MTFDRIAGDKVYDDSGYGNNGHLIGMARLARDVGKCGHGLRFQGGVNTYTCVFLFQRNPPNIFLVFFYLKSQNDLCFYLKIMIINYEK